jgi:hypothetical protein
VSLGRFPARSTTGSDGPHSIEIRVIGSKNANSSGTRVDVDAFAVLNPA